MKKPKSLVKPIRTTPESLTTLALLKEKYPQFFVDDDEKIVLLKKGIHKRIGMELKGVVSQDSIERAVRIYFGRKAYLQKIIESLGKEKPFVNYLGEHCGKIREGNVVLIKRMVQELDELGLDSMPLIPMEEEKLQFLKDKKPKQPPPPPKKKIEQPIEKPVKKVEKKPESPVKKLVVQHVQKPAVKVEKKTISRKKSVKQPRQSIAKQPTVIIRKRRVLSKPQSENQGFVQHKGKPTLSLRRKPKSE